MDVSIKLLALLFGLFVAFPINNAAQSKAAVLSSGTSPKLNEQEMRGKGLFLQRCSLCHLPPPETKPKMRPSSGPILNGLFKNAKPDEEKIVRDVILKGGPNMPGFQYILGTKEIDDLIAFMKTLNDLKYYMNIL